MKYIGSKAKYAAEIVPLLQDIIERYDVEQYVEPFVGGFNIIDKIECDYRLGNDIDPLVCNLVEACRERPQLLDTLKTPTREEYYDVRDNPEKYAPWYRAAILLFASYNARVYGGCYGATAKTKDGKERNYFEEAKANFKRQLPSLRNVLIGCCDYRDLRFPIHKTVLIYCDPPYADSIGYGKEFDTAAFWEWCRRQSEAGHIVIVSEYNAPDDFVCIWERDTKTHLNNREKHDRKERLFAHIAFDRENPPAKPTTADDCRTCQYFLSCECFDGSICCDYKERMTEEAEYEG